MDATQAITKKIASVAVGTLIPERPPTDPYDRVYAYGSYEGGVA